ncbi:SelB domain-containing protein, partial [Thauera sp. ZXT1-4]|uniref:SelB domain-containing protein n=1 Tax=Thauera sp. ZXT1-4 TaxID=3460294 RepID=UPI004040AC7D
RSLKSPAPPGGRGCSDGYGGRKRAIQILEFFDRVGFTRRVGAGHRLAHVLRGEPPAWGEN